MSTTFLISFICYASVAFISISFGSIYLLKEQFMPYHRQAVGYSWSELEPNIQVLIVALMRATGGGFLASGLAIFILLMIPLRTGNIWASYAISAIAICNLFGSLYATRLVKTQTSGNPPFGLSLIATSLIVIGFIFSLIQ